MQIAKPEPVITRALGSFRRWRSPVLVITVLALLYLVAVIASGLMLIGVDPRVDKLAFGAAELIFKSRGIHLNPSAKYPSADCFVTDCRPTGARAEYSYQATIKFSGAKLFNARPGVMACNAFLLEPLWRTGCGQIWVEQKNLSASELELALSFFQQPCRYADQTHQEIEQAFECWNGKAMKQPRVLLTIDPGEGVLPERLKQKPLS